MAKRRVFEIAKERGMTSKEVIEKLSGGGIPVRAAQSTVEDRHVNRILGPPPEKPAETETETNGAAEAEAAERAKAEAEAAKRAEIAAKARARHDAEAKAKAEADAGEQRLRAEAEAVRAERQEREAAEQARAEKEAAAREEAEAAAREQAAARARAVAEKEAERAAEDAQQRAAQERADEAARAQQAAAEERARAEAEAAAKAKAEQEALAKAQADLAERRRAAAESALAARSGKTPTQPVRAAGAEAGATDGKKKDEKEGEEDKDGKPTVGEKPKPGAGPKILALPEPPKKPKRDESQNLPANRGGGPGGPARRRVVIDSQAVRLGPGGSCGPGGPGRGLPRRQRRGRRRRGTYDDTVRPLDESAQSATDLIKVNSGSTVKDVAEYLGVPVPEVIKKLMTLGEMATLTQTLADDAIQVIADEFDKKIEIVHVGDEADDEPAFDDLEEDLVDRPPVVTIMGHVDHGKTSLLDAIREEDVVGGEAGGITQHIGAYQVHHGDKIVTFLDTPGHEAFTAMRARGAKVTDIAVIVVAADDGVKPQTVEAIDHAKAADVPILVAVNKIDLEGADPTRVRTEMTQRQLQPAEWGGETEFVDVSAKTRQGLEDLLDTILVVAELEDLKANPETEASGIVIESKLDPGRGPVVTLLLQRGTLEVGDAIVAGPSWGKVRAMTDYHGARIEDAGPGDPVEVLGFDGVPDAGELFRVVENEREGRRLANGRAVRLKTEALARRSGRKVSLEDVFKRAKSDELKELNLLLKADVSGSIEAFEDEIAKLPHEDVQVTVIRSGVGGINESDVMLAAASDAVILGFNVRPVGEARQLAEREGVEIRSYSVIYKALDDVRDAMEGLLEPEEVEETVGTIEVRQTFRASRIGTIAGCYVTEGKVTRGAKVRVIRDGTVVYDTRIETLRRFNDDVREVATGYECGIVLQNYQDVKEGDELEVYETRQVERELG